ncbi:AbrB/MazE/SpoVT family DNA-binding domain-containing protein [uncultured Jatrophihabitans sp.]|uniref:AbrB/MazE/SpoVT family DNA-binding domain-containing protein n=1 Tax=uncultured Jatrophihabitans sp. TaxID=1610747 RepID=UPI0035C96E86
MSSAKVTSKGQVTIPVDVRRKLGLQPGSRLTFEPTDDGGYEIHAEGSTIRDLKGAVEAPASPVSLEDMDTAIAAGARGSMR